MPLVTPDGRYIVVRGRLWRATNPSLPEPERQRLTQALMDEGLTEAQIAKVMGGNMVRTRTLGLIAVTLLAGAATAAAGPIGFVGLMVPHAVRWFTGPDWRWICAFCVIAGPALLLAADIVGRVVVSPGELPAGIVTAFLGAPVLIWLVRRSKASAL